MKRMTAMLLALIMCFSMLVVPANAATDDVLTVVSNASAQTAAPGDTITVTVEINSNPGFHYLRMVPVYDESVMTFVEYVDAGDLEWDYGPQGACTEGSKKNRNYTGEAFAMTFTVNDSAVSGDYEVGASVSEAWDGDEQAITYDASYTTVKVAMPCDHAETDTSYTRVEGTETHTVTVTCANEDCGITIGDVTTADCVDEGKDGTCDLCGGTVEVPASEFDVVTVDLKELTKLSRYNDYYFTVPEGKDLKVILTDSQAIQSVDDMSASKGMAYTSEAGGEFVITAEELAKHFVDDEWRGYATEDYGIDLQENSGLLWLYVFNSNTYTLLIEVIPEAPACDHAETTTAYVQVAGTETHTVTVTCANEDCGITIGDVTTADCVDEGKDGTCDRCGGTVEVPAPAVEGYTVTMPADIEVMTGENVSVPIVIDNGDADTYNAFDISFIYDPAVLELTSTEIEGMTVTPGTGSVTVQRYGTDLTVGSAAFTLTFEAIGTGEATIAVDTTKPVKVGTAQDAAQLDAYDATVTDADTKVTIGGYTVILPDDFTSAGTTVKPGDAYTFEAKDKNYDYTVKATINGNEITLTGDGTYTIPADQITGNIVITSTKTGKLFDVTLGADMSAEKSGEDAAQYMTNYVATLTKAAGYGYNVTVTINNVAYTDFKATDNENGTVTYTIPGADIKGDIVFDSGKAAGDFTVSVTGSGAGDTTYAATAEGGKAYSFTVTKAANYTYEVTATMGGNAVELTEVEGTYTIANVTGNIAITVNKTADLAPEVSQYVALNNKTIFLVKVPGELAEGKAYAFGGETMYYSNVYKAWSWLVIVEEGQTFDAAAAIAKIAVIDAAFTTLEKSCDVNMTNGNVDVNDAQLVYNMYNGHYADFTVATVQKFLYADTTGDGILNTQDAAAVVSAILAGRAAQ